MDKQQKSLLPLSQGVIGRPGHVGFRPPSEKSVALMRTLLQRKNVSEQVREALNAKLDTGELSQYEVGRTIIWLKTRNARGYDAN